ncbi:hypothetical protein POZ13_05295 [Bacteroides uniformis]|uniref:DUF6562 domain-containing protein n=1 Tax=Bacteroides uniformis TaxID=820 RepID=UPI00233E5AF6|nr:DUF6562 domain-containing protein [Bacteroides uniformis]MDC1824370.1 hypothetical protein [Bacteroides uniformis]MDC1826065.1 hypothetical protein [Bacteroides uniformis]MDC1836337.1 hypothetical protein [Bacteroides uniformis]
MKKNLFMSMLAIAGMLFATSCSQDELLNEPTTGDYVSAKFTIGTSDGIATRATIGNGTKADKVACAVYDEKGTELRDLYAIRDVVDMKATYEIRLAKGQKYRVAFFAYNSTADAYDVTYLTDIKVKDSQNSNIENRDAFTAYVDVDATVNTINEDVTLYRPFAQLNLGVDNTEWTDAVKAGVTVAKSKIVVTNVYNQFSAYDNAVVATAEPVTMTFAMNTIPTEELEVDVDRDGTIANTEKFKYLALNYLLVGDAGTEKSLTDVEFVWENSDASKTNNPTTHFKNIPVQRNYRTNIIGKLLTNPATFNIVIDADFIDSPENDYIVSVWDGESATTPVADADGVYRISSAEELVGMMNDSKSPNCNNYQNVVLECDIDLGGNTISGFGDDSGFFDGIFDGQGHSISNFKIDATNRTYYAGLFNQVSQYSGTNTVIKNLIVKNATVAGTSQVGVIVGGMNGNTIVENCKVYNSTVKAVKKVGSVVGYTAGGTVKDNYAENCVIEYSEKEASEILGYENTGSTVSGNTFNNITFVVSATALATELTPDANGVITLTRDYTVTGDWTSLALSGTVTIEGNNHTIKGINQPLVAGTGGINITVNDLTISESVIGIATVEHGLGTAAFISYIDHSGKASFTNCHLFESKVTGNERAAALLAFSEASEVSIKNCSVVKCELTSVGGAAGLVAYTHSTTTVENSKVENTIVEATEDRTSKTALAGAVIGTVNANTTFTNVTVSGNTVKNNGADAHSDMVGRVVSGTLTVN